MKKREKKLRAPKKAGNTAAKTRQPKFKDRAATKISGVAIVGFTVGLVALVIMIIATLAKANTANINSAFSNIANSNAVFAEEVIGAADNAAGLLQNYLQMSFETEAAGSSKNTITRTSRVVSSIQLNSFAYEREGVLLNTMWSTVEGSDSVIAMGALFESGAFDSSAPNYTLYVTAADADAQTAQTLGFYKTYSQNEFYASCLATKSPYMSTPAQRDGMTVITVSYPVLMGDEFKGVIAVELNLNRLQEITSDVERFSSSRAVVLNENLSVVYNSDGETGMADSERFGGKYDLVEAGIASGEEFVARPADLSGSTVICYYAPIETIDGTWWTCISISYDDLISTQKVVFITSAVMAVLVLVVVTMLLIIVVRRTLKPLGDIMAASENISGGVLDVEMNFKSKDEIGILGRDFAALAEHQKKLIEDVVKRLNRLADGDFTEEEVKDGIYGGYYVYIIDAIHNINANLSDAMRQIDQSAEQVSSGAEQVSDAAQSLSQGATEQASSVEQLSATIIECTNDIQHIAGNAQEAKGISVATGEGVMECNRFMKELTAAMDEITRTASEIGNIIKTIDDIAFQTNILALNAAVEAARAGAAGKGFAVVADEVRSLAGKSAEAAQNTTDLIEKTVNAIKNGKSIADETAASLLTVVEKTAAVNERVEDIAEASQRQYEAMSQISSGVEQISGVVQTNSATSEQSAAASEELTAQARAMKDQVGRFKLADEQIGFAQSW